MALIDPIALEKIIQIIESRTDLTPSEYHESKKMWLTKILDDKDLTKDLVRLYSNYTKAQIAIMEFVNSTQKGDFPQ